MSRTTTDLLYLVTIVTFILALVVKEGALELDFEDEIVRETCVTHDHKVLKEAAVA